MESQASVPHSSAFSRFLATNFDASGSDDYGLLASDRLQQLKNAKWQFVHYDRKSVLEKVLNEMEAPSPAEFSLVDCGEIAVKVAIKLDLSGVVTNNGQAFSTHVIEGDDTSGNQSALQSALYRALVFLDHNYGFSIHDFSSRSIAKMKKLISMDDLDQSIMAAENVSAQFLMVLSKCKEFVMQMRRRQCCDHFNGPFSDKGRVYGAVIDDFSILMEKVDKKSKELVEELVDLKDERNFHEAMLTEEGLFLEREGRYHDVDYPCKEMLARVLSYYGLLDAQYTNTIDPHGYATSKCVFYFPHIPGFQLSGNIEVSGKSYCSVQAEEDAAFQALRLIEKHFLTKICDYNFTKCRKVTVALRKITDMLSKSNELGLSWRSLFAKLTNAALAKRGLFDFDPSNFFQGSTHAGQIEAFHNLRIGLTEFEKCSADSFDACKNYFQVFQKLAWKVIAAESEIPLVADD